MLLFDIGANRGDATVAGLNKGYTVVAIEAAPRIFKQLVANFIYNPGVIPLRMAVSNTNNETIEFYEAQEDGLSTMNKDWLTADGMPYKDKPFRSVSATTITIDSLVNIYGTPDLIKIDVEGAEWSVFKGMTKNYGPLVFEWTDVTLQDHVEQLKYLEWLGYTEYALQFITHHLEEPDVEDYVDIASARLLRKHVDLLAPEWEEEGWKVAGLRPTSDVGMIWVK